MQSIKLFQQSHKRVNAAYTLGTVFFEISKLISLRETIMDE